MTKKTGPGPAFNTKDFERQERQIPGIPSLLSKYTRRSARTGHVSKCGEGRLQPHPLGAVPADVFLKTGGYEHGYE